MTADLDDVLDDLQPPRRCPACDRPLDVAPLAEGSLVLALVCRTHGPMGAIDTHDLF
ncbi:hypothetical protein [Microbacterium aureliae]